MTFRNQLTLTFTGLTTVILLVMCVIIYLVAEQFTRRQYFQRLMDRGMVAAQMYLEQDEFSAQRIQRTRRKFFQSLSDEKFAIYDQNRKLHAASDSIGIVISDKVFQQVKKEGFSEFWQGNQQGVGLWYEDNEGDFYVLVLASDITGTSKLHNLRDILIISVLLGCLVMVLAGHFFARKVLQPIVAIVQEVNKIRASHLHLRVQERPTRDEIGELIHTFNQMLERLETSFYMQKSFIANASHELRNPLTAIRGELEVTLLKDRGAAEYKESLETLQKETERLEKLTSDLILLAQTGFDEQVVRQEQVRLDEVLLEVKADLNHQQPQNQIHLNLSALPDNPDQVTVPGNPNLLQIALKNVLENASKFSDHQEVRVLLSWQEHQVTVQVQDQGIGIPETEIGRVLEPFYRAQNARSRTGTGIGLAMTEKIMRLHGGSIQIESSMQKGTTVTLLFPSVQQ
ncbi:ATP-binding protein [Rufibacter glacialis]|uniref:histidine kinase n=1 Tax=Rufibacter glacialis TaxID=1259555 RepID=A0A5M8QIY5_9BACT|nr:HAMP domain-containing sensor histidine kinase [Rufibacter glacialis]KAA6434736.1 HAMP domain-containing histidine kinase [Rufibacter glacialis]GGK72004.1 two-component sensor histidine kinase [Rufibacter glacialis]